MKRNGIFILVGLAAAIVVTGLVVTPLAVRLKNSPAPKTKSTTASAPDKKSNDALLSQASVDEIKDRIQTSKTPLLLVNLWASWCGPCKIEFPGLIKLREKYKDRGFDLLLISLDQEEQRPDAEEFLKDNQVDFQTFFKGSQSTGFVQPLFPSWQGAIPASFLVNRDMQVLESWIGETTTAEFETKILSHLPKP